MIYFKAINVGQTRVIVFGTDLIIKSTIGIDFENKKNKFYVLHMSPYGRKK